MPKSFGFVIFFSKCFVRKVAAGGLSCPFSLRDEASNPKAKHKSPTVPVPCPTPYFSMGWDMGQDKGYAGREEWD